MPLPSVTSFTFAPSPTAPAAHHQRVSVNLQGTASGDSLGGDISANGRYVVFLSTASNLVAGDTNGVADIFRKDLQTGVVELVSATATGEIGNGISGLANRHAGVGASKWSLPSISENGRYVGFVSAAQNLPGAAPGIVSGYVKDMRTGEISNVSTPLALSLGQPGGVETVSVSMGQSGLARVVVDPLSGFAPEVWRVQVTPVQTYTMGPGAALPVAPFYGTVFGFGREPPTLGADMVGWNVPTTRILTHSLANNPLLGDGNNLGDVILDAMDGARVISRQLSGPGGGPAAESNQASFPGFLSLDGRVATFFTDAVNIEAGAATPDSSGGLVFTDPTTVWAYHLPNAADFAAHAEGRRVELSFGLEDARAFSVTWGDKTTLAGPTGGAEELRLAKTYAALGSYSVTLTLDGPGGTVTETARLHLLERNTAATLIGGGERDFIFAGERDDLLQGRAGHDVIHAGGGDDVLVGGSGADTLFGEAGDDRFYDGPGLAFADVYVGGAGRNTLNYGGTGESMMIRLDGEELAHGAATAGYATVLGPSGPVTDLFYDMAVLIAGDGQNTIFGSAGDDSILGGRRADYIEGGAGDDTLLGGRGDDTLRGGFGHDQMAGGDGDDLIFVTGGQAVAQGGAGRNTLFLEFDYEVDESLQGWTLDMATGLGTRADGASLSFQRFSTIGADRAIAVQGSANAETFLLGPHASFFAGNGGFDTLSARAQTQGVLMDASLPSGEAQVGSGGGLEGGGGTTQFSGIRGFEGGSGADTIIGSALGDRISGREGDDVLEGLAGKDSLTGGLGADTFVLGFAGPADILTDFTSGTDQIWIYAGDVGLLDGPLDPGRLTLGATALGAFPQLVFDGATGMLSWDGDGDGAQAGRALAMLGVGSVLAATDVVIV